MSIFNCFRSNNFFCILLCPFFCVVFLFRRLDFSAMSNWFRLSHLPGRLERQVHKPLAQLNKTHARRLGRLDDGGVRHGKVLEQQLLVRDGRRLEPVQEQPHGAVLFRFEVERVVGVVRGRGEHGRLVGGVVELGRLLVEVGRERVVGRAPRRPPPPRTARPR